MILQGYHQVAGRFPSEMHCHGPPSPGCASGPRHYCGSTRSGGRSGWTANEVTEVYATGVVVEGIRYGSTPASVTNRVPITAGSPTV